MIRFWIATVALSALLLGGCPPMTMPDDMSGGDTSVDDGNGDGGAPPVTMRPDDDNNAGGDTNPSGDGSNTGGDTGGDNGSTGGDNGGDSNSSGDNAGGDSGNGDNAGGDSGNGDAGNNGGNTDPGDSGNPNDGGGDDGGDADQAARAGTFSGSVTFEVTQGVFDSDGFLSNPLVVDMDVTFDEDGNLTQVFVPGYSDTNPDQIVEVLNPGEQTGLSTALIEYLSVDYTDTTVTIQLKVIQNRTSGSLQQVGEGLQTVTLSITGDNLTFDSMMRYEVELSGTGPSVPTSETYTATGETLTRQ